uniref:Probable serine/threonine-protein kinase DDB_G0286465 n=1 Tax=Nicotiana tabacum TaxID=4097 RepID=A0A1S4DMN4_TOBAC|nr:PREDICTED: probable serine/threonine-protein kinase DDB_G0286465 [Nicotiana tabacum]
MVILMDPPQLPFRAPLLEPKTTPNHAYTLWFRQDQLIQNALMASVDPTIASRVAAANTSKQAWDSLHTSYANKSQTRIFSLRDQLARITKDTTPITEYLQCIRSLSNELAIARAPVTNSELIVKIFSELGSEFCEISAAIRDTTTTYEELYEKLLDHELFLHHEEAKKTTGPITAAIATHNKSNNNSNSRNNRRQYYNNNNNNNNSKPWRQNTRPNTTS